MFETILIQPLANLLVIFTNFFGSLGWGIIVTSLIIKLALIPLTLPSLKSSEKIKKLGPKLEELKKKYKNDREKLAKAQVELYRQEGISPAAGCLPTIIQMVILLALYQVFNKILNPEMISQLPDLLYKGVNLPAEGINFSFWYLDLTKPDLIASKLPGFFLSLSAISQFLTVRSASPSVKAAEKTAEKTPAKNDDLAMAMQKQMIFLMPLMTIVIGYRFPGGLSLYWFVFSLIGLIQQYIVSRNKS
jgi:YidC/Oxa1 family membrane protein insertase